MTTDNDGLRLRRTKSVTRAEEIVKEEQKLRKQQPDKPCHRPRDSLFSWSSGFTNFTGLVNWAVILLTMGGIRLLLENLIKYGIRIDPQQWLIALTGSEEGPGLPSVYLFLYSAVPCGICLLVEKGIAEHIIPVGLGLTAHVVNIILMITIPMVVITLGSTGFSLMGASCVCFIYSVVFLKLWSYVQVNHWCRKAGQTSQKGIRRQSVSFNNNAEKIADKKQLNEDIGPHIIVYPDNVHVKDLLYFIWAPTLCYELNFPRTDRIRKRFLLKRIIEVVVLFQLIACLFQQWIIPSVKNSLIPFSNMDVMKATERLLKLSIPNHLVWLTWFYLMFHSFLNLVGELLHFADRNFYCDWWNANNIDTFWRTWNMPVHRWAVRHLYIPLVDQGYSKIFASTSVFFLSAFLHEYLISVPLRTFKIWAFMGMMGQIPLSIISRFVEKSFGEKWGNVIVWTSLILGQPLCIMMYYHDYVITRFGKSLIDSYAEV
uniref:O-acyltransferase n=1 Tax=Lygus hesperus TaxID=30085 RepID=A0A0A9Z8M6_LYGHE